MKLYERAHFYGPNRYGDSPAMELWLACGQADHERLQTQREKLTSRLSAVLARHPVEWQARPAASSQPAVTDFGHLMIDLICALLESAGHHIAFRQLIDLSEAGKMGLVIGGDDVESDICACVVAFDLVEEALPGLVLCDFEPPALAMAGGVQPFLEHARSRAMCLETRTIIRVARWLGIPVAALDRYPYEGVQSEDRIRPNGLLALGHCGKTRVLEGSLFVDQPGNHGELARNPDQRRSLLAQARVPHADQCPEGAAHYAILVVGEDFAVALKKTPAGWQMEDDQPHPMLVKLARSLATRANAAAIALQLFARNVAMADGLPPADTLVRDFDLAPDLGVLLGAQPKRLEQACRALLRAAFGSGETGEVPSIAITGTNGKTTTSMLITRILMAAGKTVGYAGTLGVFVDHEMIYSGDLSGFPGHRRIFERTDVDVAVLETARGGILSMGFAFDRCDVSICTNVTEDHLGPKGIDTVDDMAQVKASVVRRARGGVVLNADDDYCAMMADDAGAEQLGIISSTQSLSALTAAYPTAAAHCVVAHRDGVEQLVLYQRGEEMFAMAVGDIPATAGGAARHNIENAMQAAMACQFLGIDAHAITTGLAGFEPSADTINGRLNHFRGQALDVILDYAHNPGGLERMVEFVTQLDVQGRRIAIAGAPGDRGEQQAKNMMRIIAPHYDHFILRPSSTFKGFPDVTASSRLCQRELLALGCPPDRVHRVDDARGALAFALELAREGDLLVVHASTQQLEIAWEMITTWPGNPAVEEP